VPRNLEATLWLASSLLVLFSGVLVLGSVAFIALCGVSAFPRAAHDLGDLVSARMPGFARASLLASLVLLPVAFGEGPLGLVFALFAVGVLYGGARHRMALSLAAVLLVLGLFPLAQLAGRALSILSADPVAESALAVRQGIQSANDIALLSAAEAEDLLAARALAAHASQRGELEQARVRYEALADQLPRDPVIATNLANLHLRRGAVDEAVALYQIASMSLESPILWFNLSQAYARSFRMELFETALGHAQQLGDAAVAELSQLGDSGFVSDLPLPIESIRGRMLAASHGGGFAASTRAKLAPGRLGLDWRLPAALLALLLVASLTLSGRFEQAGSCSRCGVRVCARCDGTVWDMTTCDNCHRLFHNPASTDPSLRAARLEHLRRREARVERAAQLGSFAVPGLGGVLAGRPDLGFLAMLSFGWAVASVAMRSGAVPDPLVLGAAGPMILLSTAIFAGSTYGMLVLASVAIRRSQ
jgi:tetratricopeptide (TPR) repeat protein